ncbi:MAG TPA: ATP-binding protein [Gemmatimonadaceae bacterium]|nr:ATP-binding protein [Gemmatimonadaceae bacterium]
MGVHIATSASAPRSLGSILIEWMRPALRVPLLGKLLGANAIIVVLAASVIRFETVDSPGQLAIMVGAFFLAVAVNMALVWIALRPLHALERIAEQLWRGDLDARVPSSPLADAHMERTGTMLNSLLDALAAERQRLRHLAAQVIRVGDEERMRITHELHESVAQQAAALMYQAASGVSTAKSETHRDCFETIRVSAASIVNELQALSQSIHPRVLDDLGVEAALSWLVRTTRDRTDLDVQLEATGGTGLPTAVEWTLYRVAQESLRNIERHANATTALVRLTRDDRRVQLEITDDGVGFDVADAEARRPGMGLFSVRERLALVNGTLCVDSAQGAGTRILATVPI